jgi:hypothetical protein
MSRATLISSESIAQPSYFKDTFELKKLLDDLELPPNASLFTADATSMYTNIPTEPALEELAAYLRTNDGTPKHHYHCDSLIAALEIVFRNNLSSVTICLLLPT